MMASTHSSSSQSTAPTSNAGGAGADPDAKVLSDLSTLNEQISLCQSMLVNAGPLSSIQSNEALLTVIGFLEACVPRMMELIEAAAQGALKPGTFEECLVVNDKLTNVLADVEKDPGDRTPLTPAATSSGGAASAESSAIDDGMNKLSVGDSSTAAPAAAAGGKTTGLDAADDPFAGGPDLLDPTPVSDAEKAFTISDSMGSVESAPDATKKAEDDDDFDAFFRDRTSAP